MENLIGKNILEVIVELSKHNWNHRAFSRKKFNTKIDEFLFVYYEWNKPRSNEDLYRSLNVNGGLSLNDLEFIEKEKGRGIGLTSQVRIKELDQATTDIKMYIPFIDFDVDKYKFDVGGEKNLLEIIKYGIKHSTEIKKGLILKSSSSENLHFIGTDMLLSEEDFITFLGLCLTIGYKKSPSQKFVSLADSRYIGHSLTPVKYLAELNNEAWSKYDNIDRFSTLRVNPKNNGGTYPVVIDILK
mgnify:CR=1 FL=1